MQLQLSVITVNFNVKYFLGHCLASVEKALQGIEGEIIVVDNASTDDSIAYLQPLFPKVIFIENNTNVGFGKACNVGVARALGKYILFLNPDTLVGETVLQQCIAFIETTKNCGAIGVQMIDGSGNFLAESKRSFPTIAASFFKLSGLATLFSASKKVNKYALGHIDKNSHAPIDIIAGAFMLLSKKIFDKCNGFDEQFFMYGEDVDLSYRIQKNGYQNFYIGTSSIVHFKGESISKLNLQYTKMFYGAMAVFVQKHYQGNGAKLFIGFIQLAIRFTALASFIKQSLKKIALPLLDMLLVFTALFCTERAWVHIIKKGVEFNTFFVPYAIPLYTVVFIIAAFVSGIYDSLYKPSKALLASVSAMIVLLALYALLPENIRFSRGVVLVGGMLAALLITLSRWLLFQLNVIEPNQFSSFKTIVIGSENDVENIGKILQQSNQPQKIIGRIGVAENDDVNTIGSLQQINQLIKNLNINEVVFSESALLFQQIILYIQQLPNQVVCSFYSPQTHSIISSKNKNETGQTHGTAALYSITQPYQKRMKRLVDVVAAFLLLITFPLQLIFVKHGLTALKNCWLVLINQQTFVGYSSAFSQLPALKKSVISCSNKSKLFSKAAFEQATILYAKEYDWWKDVQLIISNYRYLGG